MKKVIVFLFLLMGAYVSYPALIFESKGIGLLPSAYHLLSQFFPPDFSILPDLKSAFLETFQIAYWATGLSFLISVPLALLASQKIYNLKRGAWGFIGFLAFLRTIPALVWAILFVALVGPYPLAGVLALMFYSISYLAKFFMDALDSLDFKNFQWLKLHGVSTHLAFRYSLWPEIKPLLLSQFFWMFEYNIRSASIIGYVGTGGLGLQLYIYQEYGQWDKFSVILIVIFLLTLVLEVISRLIRFSKT